MKSGNLNFLEPSGPLQACNGTALPLLLHLLLERMVLELAALLEVRSGIYVWMETKASEGSKQWSEEYNQVWEVVFGVEL
jgi:hypothetical protein